MDKIDNEILVILQENARTPNSDIAKKLDMAPSAIWERIKKLEEQGVIKQYSALVDPATVGLDILAFVNIQIDSANWTNHCSENIESIANVEELYEVIGEDSYLAKVRAKDMNELSEILKNKISAVPKVKSTRTVIVTKVLKEGPILINTNLK